VTRLSLGCLILVRSLIQSFAKSYSLHRSKINHGSLSCFHGASHLSQVPWREVEGHYSPGDEPSVTLAQLHNELARAHLRRPKMPSTTSNDLITSAKWDGSNETHDGYTTWMNKVRLWANNNDMA